MKRANKNETRKKNAHQNASIHDGIKVAILVDGGFYSKRENTPSIEAIGFHRMGGDESRFIF